MKLTWKKAERVEAKISQCVHYAGFRYGHKEYNPYETYIRRLHEKEDISAIRAEFINFLLHYRPRCFGEALGINLSRKYPLWLYPWANKKKFWKINYASGWFKDPNKIPDIITHFSDSGIPMPMILKEYGWLHSAYQSIISNGYNPEVWGYPKARLFFKENGEAAYLMLDGNHRLSVLSTLGFSSLLLDHYPSDAVRNIDIDSWQGVRNGFFTKEDAVNIFEAYFSGNKKYYTTTTCPPILGSLQGDNER